MQITSVVASKKNLYTLAQISTSSTTYTIPTGVYQISGFCIGAGAAGANGSSASGTSSGAGGLGGGGGGTIGFWNYSVVPGQVWTITIDSSGAKLSYGTTFIQGANASGSTGGIYSQNGFTLATSPSTIVGYSSVSGNNAAAVGSSRSVSGDGGNAGDKSNVRVLTTPAGLGFASFSGGYAGGSGGGGAKATSTQSYTGGKASTTFQGTYDGAAGGAGGNAQRNSALNGFNGSVPSLTINSNYGHGGGGGGGGAYQDSYGPLGTGGTGAAGTSGAVFIYTR